LLLDRISQKQRDKVGNQKTLGYEAEDSYRQIALGHPAELFMLMIRREQMAALGACQQERYIMRMVRKLDQLFPRNSQADDDQARRALVVNGIARAARYEITSEPEVALFVFLMKEYGPGFEQQKDKHWMESILADKTMDEQEKMAVIYKRLELIQRKP